MDLQNIQEQLNNEFRKSDTRIVFWFDDKGEYEDEVTELQLENASIHVLDGSNWFYTKWLLNASDEEGKYLVYAPFVKPIDEENPLADICHYATPYYTDRVSQMSQELGIDSKFKEHLSKYSSFWKNKNRIEKFKALGIEDYNVETIDRGLMAVLIDEKNYSFEEIVKRILLSDSDDYIKILENYGLLDRYWELCSKYFGYASDKPSMYDMTTCMIITYAASAFKHAVPKNMKNYILKKRNDVVVFIRNIMDNRNSCDRYDELADKVDKSLRITAKIEEDFKKDINSESGRTADVVQMSDILDCDAFKGMDYIIINWALEQLNNEILDAQIDGMNIARIVEHRLSKAFHYGDKYRYEYEAIKYAYLMMKSVSLMEYTSDIEQLVQKYKEETYLIDSYYRWFYYAYDKIENSDRYGKVRERVENIYANTYLQKLLPKWNSSLNDDTIKSLGLVKQVDFFKHYMTAYDGKQRIIVIISDALRYECAKELVSKLEMDAKCDAKLECMLGVLPSVTSVGMASLLPHNDLKIDDNMGVTVDGKQCGDMDSRDKILKEKHPQNMAVAFDIIAKADRQTINEMLKGKNIVYIYHNQVDARGDKPASENEVFNACSEAIDEIMKLIKNLSYASINKIYITADHGFLYRRDRLQEFDKVSYPKEVCTYSNKRYLLTKEKVNEQGVMSRLFAYTNPMYVTTPIGADIFKVAGGGQNFVHGGSSLQEMLIPVIDVKTERYKKETDYVNVVLTSVTRKVTNLITYFDFIQTDKVTDVMKGRNVIAYFATEDGEKISFDVPICANSKEDEPEKRTFHEKFTLKTREYRYGDKYYLNIVDANDEKNVLQSYEFMIDIAFVDDFGF